MLRQLADGLASLHAAGKVHRDIKPANVLVTTAGRLVILDGGLMADLAEGPARPRRPGFSGTVTFMAPEQAQGAVTAAADWYSLGVMLYCALTGQPPYQGGFSDVMREKLAGAAWPSSLVPGVPGDLDQLCAQLLRPDPAARPPGAEIVARLGGRPLSDRARAAPAFVGRKLELEQLLELAARATLGAPTVALVEGESGVGKSALLARFIEALGEQPSPPLILRGRCFEREAVPFKAFEGIMEAVSEHLAQLPGADAREAGSARRLAAGTGISCPAGGRAGVGARQRRRAPRAAHPAVRRHPGAAGPAGPPAAGGAGHRRSALGRRRQPGAARRDLCAGPPRSRC